MLMPSLTALLGAIWFVIYFCFKAKNLIKYGGFTAPGDLYDPFQIEFSRYSVNCPETYEMTRDVRYPIQPEDKTIARRYPDSLFAKGLAENPTYEVTPEDILFVKFNRGSVFAEKLTERMHNKQGKKPIH
jgi:hypothetical protein